MVATHTKRRHGPSGSTLALGLLLTACGGCLPGGYGDAELGALPWPMPPDPAVWPTDGWARSTPEAEGLSSARLAEAIEHAARTELDIHSLTIVRNGALVLDAYFQPFPDDALHDVASVTKSVVSLLVGIAVEQRAIDGLDVPLARLLPQGGAIGGRTARLRLGDALAMRSGLDCDIGSDEYELDRMRRRGDWARHVLSLPMATEPGRRFGYCSPAYHVVSAALQEATGSSALDFARANLFGPLGVTDVDWPADPQGVSRGWGDLRMQPRDLAKLGLLILHHGRWEDREVVPAEWLARSFVPRSRLPGGEDYGLGWWISKDVPGMIVGVGRGGQRLFILPDRNIVAVTTGGGFDPGELAPFLLAAVRSDTALPEDPDGTARLHLALEAAARSHAGHDPAPAPGFAARVSGTTYRFGPNPLGIEALTIEFADPSEARLRAVLEDRMRFVLDGLELDQPVGLDGRYRIVRNGAGGPVLAARGDWAGESFVMDLDFVGLGFRMALGLRFDEDRLDLDVRAPAIDLETTLTGVRAPAGCTPATDQGESFAARTAPLAAGVAARVRPHVYLGVEYEVTRRDILEVEPDGRLAAGDIDAL